MTAVAVLGAGVAGLAAGSRLEALGLAATVFEKTTGCGGHARSIVHEGFTFDEGPHVSFTKDVAVQRLFAEGAEEVLAFPLELVNAFEGMFIKHPVQCHLSGVRPDLVAECITDLVAAHSGRRKKVRNYDDWCVRAFGRAFADTFTFPYTRKYWTVQPCELTTDWVERRMYSPKLIDMVRGALGQNEGEFHYISEVRYPARGGFQAFLGRLSQQKMIATSHDVMAINPMRRRIEFLDGASVHYDALISTLPLPALINVVDPTYVAPQVRQAAERLFCSSVALVEIGAAHVEAPAHIVYVYDERFACSRINFPHRIALANAPPGRVSVQAEVYYSAQKPLPTSHEHLAERVVEELLALRLLKSHADVLFARVRDVPFANVLFTGERAAAVRVVRRWLRRWNIEVAGRYGEWAYYWTDDAVRSGWRAADAVAARLGVIACA